MSVRLALYEPDIPQNTGTMLRLCACLGVGVDVIEPCGFVWNEKRMRRAGMDYLDQVALIRHDSWVDFFAANTARLVLVTTRAAARHTDFRFHAGDTLLVGRESAGVPETVHAAVDEKIRIPMRPTLRSINVAMSAAVVLGEALRQLDAYPAEPMGEE